MNVTSDDVEHYRTQGFVHLRGVLNDTWVDRLREAIAQVQAEADFRPRIMNLSAMKRADKSPDKNSSAAVGVNESTDRDFLLANNAWQWNAPLRTAVFESPLAAVAAKLMSSTAINFYFDQVFLKPPRSELRTAFHQDLGYWTCKGDQICTLWTAIDTVTHASGAMGYVPGSHLWDDEFKANVFVDTKPIPGQEGSDLPDILADEARYGVVYCECEPGDVIVHHVKTVHGSKGNITTDQHRRSVGFRFAGDDVTYHEPPGLPPDSTPIADYLKEGEPLSGELFPQVWGR